MIIYDININIFYFISINSIISGVHMRTLNFEIILTTTVPKGIKPGVFVRVDNVAVIKLEDNCKFWNYKITTRFLVVIL